MFNLGFIRHFLIFVGLFSPLSFSNVEVKPFPILNFSTNLSNVYAGNSFQLNWDSQNTRKCEAGGAWEGDKPTSGNEIIVSNDLGEQVYKITCIGPGGTVSKELLITTYKIVEGVVVDGYIRDAKVFSDRNNNFRHDSDEYFTSSNEIGSFELRFGKTFISLDGYDAETGNKLKNFLMVSETNNDSEFFVISPLTTVKYFFENKEIFHSAIGIDSSLNVNTFDPIKNLNNGNEFETLFEKGTQLGILAFSLQNIINQIEQNNQTTKVSFSLISKQAEEDFQKRGTEIDFLSKSFLLSLFERSINNIENDTLDDLVILTSSFLDVVDIKETKEGNDAILNFAYSTFQDDLYKVLNTSLSSEILNTYQTKILEYVAYDQNIETEKLISKNASTNNSAPIIQSGSTFYSYEGSQYIGDLDIIDEDTDLSDLLVWPQYGGSEISITYDYFNSGRDLYSLSFINTPDYENQQAYGCSDVEPYNLLRIGVTDGANVVSQDICVRVMDIENESSPIFISSPQYLKNGTDLKIGEILAYDPDGDYVQFFTSDSKLQIQPVPNPFSKAYKADLKLNPDIDLKSLGDFTSMITATDGLYETDQSITITGQNFPPVLSKNLIYIKENIINIPSSKLIITDEEGDDISVTIRPDYAYGIDVVFGNEELLPGYANDYENITSFGTLGNADGSTYYVNSDTFSNNVKIISDIVIEEGGQLRVTGTVWSDQTDAGSYPTITVGPGTFQATSAKIRNLKIGGANNGYVMITRSSLINSIFEPPGSGSSNSRYLMNLNYFENVNVGNLIDVYFPEYFWAVNNVFYNTGQFSLALNNSNTFFLNQNIFANSNDQTTFPSAEYDPSKIAHIKYWNSGKGITTHSNQYLNQNIKAFLGNESLASSKEYFGSSGLLYDRFEASSSIQDPINNLRNSSLDEHNLDIKVQPKLIYENNSFRLDFPADYEVLHSEFRYILEISDGVNEPVIEYLRIRINDDNEAPLITSSESFSITENNDEVGSFSALDPENDQLSYASSNQSLRIEDNKLVFNSPPNFEEQNSYTSTITVSDQSKSTSQLISIQVQDTNEAPVFSKTSFDIDENSLRVGQLIVTDDDGDDISLALPNNLNNRFYIDNENVLFFNDAPDFENETQTDVVVRASDGTNDVYQTIDISINNLNDNFPVLNSNIFYVDENTEGPIATLDVTDADGDDISFPYFESWGSINSDGEIFIDQIPDYENASQYNSTVLISDGVNEISEVIYIYVNNLNDNAPTFSIDDVSYSAAENQIYVSNLIYASDLDGNGDDLIFSLINDDAADLTILKQGRGYAALLFNTAPNYEEKDSYSFDVQVTDGAFTVSEGITIAITDENDLPQFTSSNTFNSDENQQTIGTVVASDEDGQSLIYSITSPQGTFSEGVSIDGLTGNLFFNVDELPDYENQPTRAITVTATEQSNAQMSSSQDITILINNINDNEPSIVGYNEFGALDVDENISFVKDFNAEDLDGDLNEHLFSISGIDAGVFTLQSSSGHLEFTDVGQVDHENPLDDDTNNDYEITISVTDGLYTNSTDFTINVLNLNDNSPVFTCEPDNGNPNYEFRCVDTVITIDEKDQRSPNEYATVGVFSANDPDGDLLTFSIPTDSDLYPYWSIGNNTDDLFLFDGEQLSYGLVKSYSDTGDYEVASSYTGHVLVSDGENTSSRAVTINLNNINDNTPETTFTCNEEPADLLNYCYVDENDSSLILGSFTYQDADGSLNELSLSLNEYCSGSADCFGNSYTSINSELNGILIDSVFDYEVDQTTHYMYLTITDGENSSNEIIYFEVRDVNDAPEFTSSNVFSIDENQTNIGSVAATDQDGDSITYSIRQGSFAWSSFTIDSITGELNLIASADYETLPSYVIEIYADDGTDVTSQMVTVNVNDLNEAPNFTSSNNQTVDENQTSVGLILANDEDFTEDTITFSIIDGADFGFISITQDGLLTLNAAADYESQSSYSVVIRISDGNLNTDETFTINVNNLNDNTPQVTFPSSMNENDNQLGSMSVSDLDLNSKLDICLVSNVYTLQQQTHQTTITYNQIQYVSSCVNIQSSNESSFIPANLAISILGEPLNYEETDGTIDFIVYVKDWINNDSQNTLSENFYAYTTSINDVDDRPYWIVDGVKDDWQYRGSVYVDENETVLPVDINVIDEDGDNMVVSLETGSATEYNMNYNSSTSLYEITFKQAPDKEVGGPRDLIMYAVTDNWTSDLNISVYVNDVDEPPVFSSSSTFAVDENYISNGVVDIGYVVASDPESADVRYFITDGADQDKVSIDSITGLLTLNNIPNFESQSSYSIEVTAADYWITSPTQSGLYDTQNITISVNDLDEHPLVVDGNGNSLSFPDNYFTIDEGDTEITAIFIIDEDGDSTSFSLQGDGSDEISYDINTGLLSLNSAADFESNDFYDITFCALSTSLSTCTGLNISVTDLNEPSVISTTSFSVQENVTTIGNVNASADTGETLSFSITGQDTSLKNTNNAFPQDDHSSFDETDFYSLSPSENESISLTVSNIDFEMTINFKNALGNLVHTSSVSQGQTATINVRDYLSVDGSTIEFELTNPANGYTFTWELSVDDQVVFSNGCGTSGVEGCAENEYTSGVVYQSTIYLGDLGDAGDISIDEQTGDLEFNAAPDFETQDSYSVEVNVTDGISTTSETITINIIDVNEAPVFTSTVNEFEIIEGTTTIGSVAAIDEDGDTVSYSVSTDYLSNGVSFSGDVISVDSVGNLEFISRADFERFGPYTFDVIASDGNLDTTETITVKIINVDGISKTGEIYLCDGLENGIINDDCSEYSRLAASDDGSRVAISDTHTDSGDGISVYEIDILTGQWNQIGSTLAGHSGVDISGDGSRVITSSYIGVSENDPDNVVRVFEYDESLGDWSLVGSPTYPPDDAYGIDIQQPYGWGNDVAIDDDGDRIVIGAHISDDPSILGSGAVFIYDLGDVGDGWYWSLISDFGHFLVPQAMFGYSTTTSLGYDVDISDDGNVVLATSHGSNTKVFFNENDKWWERCAYGTTPTTYNDNGCDQSNQLDFGSGSEELHISLSGDSTPQSMSFVIGNRLPVQSNVRAYKWTGEQIGSDNFIAYTPDIDNFDPDYHASTYTGKGVSLNDAGTRLAVGAPHYQQSDENYNYGSAGRVNIYSLTGVSGSTLSEIGEIDIPHQSLQECGKFLDFSGNGQYLFINCPQYIENYDSTTANYNVIGRVLIYDIEIAGANSIPYFTSDSAFSSPENQTSIGTVTAADSDGDTLTFSIESDEINIDASTGALTFETAPSYEDGSYYNAQVFVTDGTYKTVQDISVTLRDLDEDAPVITSAPVFQYSEDETSRSIGFVTATDDIGPIVFSISGSGISIESSTGELTFDDFPDYETINTYSRTVYASDADNTISQYITVSVTDVDDEAPVFSTIPATLYIPEESTNSDVYTDSDLTNAVSITATDVDSGISSNLIYSFGSLVFENGFVQASDADTCFDWNHTGTFKFDGPVSQCKFDYEDENYRRFTVELIVSDGTQSTSEIVDFEIVNINDNFPTYTVECFDSTKCTKDDNYYHHDYKFDIEEEVIDLFKVYVEDLDGTPFELISAGSCYFGNNKQVAYNVSDEGDYYLISLTEAYDSDDLVDNNYSSCNSSLAYLSNDGDQIYPKGDIDWININDTLPFFEATTTTINECKGQYSDCSGSPSGGTNPSNWSAYTFSLPIQDYESNLREYRCFVSGGADASLILDPFKDTTSASIYRCSFTIDEQIDYETKSSYSFNLSVQEYSYATGFVGTDATEESITVYVNNLNDNSPVITSSNTFYPVENQKEIGTVAATDADGDTLTYHVLEYTPLYTNPIVIDTNTGELSFTYDTNFEQTFYYTARIGVKEYEGQSGYGATQNINIYVTNLNDNSPSFTSSDAFSVDEGINTIGTVEATDADGDQVTFSVSGSDVSIDSVSGALTFNSAPDYESQTSYTFTVTASDGTNTTDQEITVTINNINDNTPSITSSSTFSVAEGVSAIGTITAIDADGDNLTFSMSSTNSGSNTNNAYPFDDYSGLDETDYYQVNAGSGIPTQDLDLRLFDIDDEFTVTLIDSSGNEQYSYTASYNNSTWTTIQINDYLSTTGSTIELELYNGVSGYTMGWELIRDGEVLYSNSCGTFGNFGCANDSQSSGIVYSATIALGSNDYIDIDESSGDLSFNITTDYDSQSQYTATVNASDGLYSTSQNITVDITQDSNPAPTVSSESHTLNLLPKDQNETNFSLSGSDSNGDSLTYSLVTNPTYGSVTLNGSSVTYTTNSGHVSAQTDSFTFKANDGTSDSNIGTITIDLKTDPLYKYQWHLDNTEQSNFASSTGTLGDDLNVDSVINSGHTGSGVIINVVDEGLELAHEDLAANIVLGSYDLVDNDSDPTNTDASGDHGTSVAGISASVGWNNLGGRGVAPAASLIGYNFLKNQSGSNQWNSWGINPPGGVQADIYNLSYGYGNSGTYNWPFTEANTGGSLETALESVTTDQRNNKGALLVKSSGNDFNSGTSSSTYCGSSGAYPELACTEAIIDTTHQFPYTVVTAAIRADDTKSSYSTPGPSIWISGYGGEYGYNSNYVSVGSGIYDPAIMTTDQSGCTNGYVGANSAYQVNEFNNNSGGYSENADCNYVSTFNGTSSAAPSVSGVIALMLEANPDLTWRDVKHIIASTADKIDENNEFTLAGITQYEWETNAAGFDFHNWYGFGKINAAEAVQDAENYSTDLGTFSTTNINWATTQDVTLPFGTSSHTIDISSPTSTNNNFIEQVQLGFKLNHIYPDTVGMTLVSPSGTEVNILQPFTNVYGNHSGLWITVGVNAFYGEQINGTWTLKITDYLDDSQTGVLQDWYLDIFFN